MKIAIAHANASERQALIHLLRNPQHSSELALTLCWSTQDGASAIARCRLDPPQIVLLDLNLGAGDSVEITQQLLALQPNCKLLLTSSSLARHATQAYAAVAAGACDVVGLPQVRPSASTSASASEQQAWEQAATPLLTKLHAIVQQLREPADKPLISPLIPPQTPPLISPLNAPSIPPQTPSRMPPLIVMGASTGGPKAIAQLLAPFPVNFPAAFVIVQHVSARFANSMAEWLQQHTALKMTPITTGAVPQAGQVAIAAEDRHLILRTNRSFGYRAQSPELHYCPSINLFFESVAAHWPQPGIAIVLTGMGQDGAMGIKQLRDRGWYTLAQDQASASIHSMPQAAIDTGAVVQVLTPAEMAQVCLKKILTA